MKKILLCFLLGILFNSFNPVYAHRCYSHSYLVHRDFFQEEQTFVNCDRHSVLKETTVYYYSNGTRNSYTISTIYNQDGSILASGCYNVKHHIFKNKHYFSYYKNKKYQILSEDGVLLSTKKYKSMNEIAPNRLLVKLNKKYGVIDLQDNIIVPIKYKKFEQIDKNLFLTKLNGYYGMINSSNNQLIKNEYDKIKPLYNTYLLKKYKKYGLADKNGKIIIEAECDNIKKLGEYLKIKKGKNFFIVDENGKKLNNKLYKQILMERNTLKGKLLDNSWEEIGNI